MQTKWCPHWLLASHLLAAPPRTAHLHAQKTARSTGSNKQNDKKRWGGSRCAGLCLPVIPEWRRNQGSKSKALHSLYRSGPKAKTWKVKEIMSTLLMTHIIPSKHVPSSIWPQEGSQSPQLCRAWATRTNAATCKPMLLHLSYRLIITTGAAVFIF